MDRIVPARYQPPLPLDKLILQDGAAGAGDRMELDVLIVGAGPAGLACAIELAKLAKAEELGVNVFTGFPAAQLLVQGAAVAGVRTAPAGLDRDGNPTPGGQAPNDLVAKVTALAEGTRGLLAQAWCQWQGVASENPQIFALGVKELWDTRLWRRIVGRVGRGGGA